MPTTIQAGHSFAAGGDYCDEFKIKSQTEVMERRATNGAITKVKDYNPTADFSFKGGGDPAIALGSSSLTLTGLTGGIKMINSYEHTTKSTDFDDYSTDGKHYPSASLGS